MRVKSFSHESHAGIQRICMETTNEFATGTRGLHYYTNYFSHSLYISHTDNSKVHMTRAFVKGTMPFTLYYAL